MNFPLNQQTGADGELRVQVLFNSWGWGTGSFKVDSGYDLIVEPDRNIFDSNGFYVQVKGTAEPWNDGRNVRAQVSRHRLRQYAASDVPVFIVRTLSNGPFFWIHAQDWCLKHPEALVGDGEATVSFVESQVLQSKEAFIGYLRPILTALRKRNDGVSTAARDRRNFLVGLDNRLDVQIAYNEGRTSYTFLASDHKRPVEAKFTLKLADPSTHPTVLRTYNFGFPASIDATEFAVTGSPIFDEVGTSRPHDGQVTFTPVNAKPVRIVLYAGSVLDDPPAVEFDALLSSGVKGIGIWTEAGKSYLKFDIELVPGADANSQANLTIGVDNDFVCAHPLRQLNSMRPFVQWLEAVEDGARITVAIESSIGTISAQLLSLQAMEGVLPQLEGAYYVAKAHWIARRLGSDFILPRDRDFSRKDIRDITAIHAILTGKTVALDIKECFSTDPPQMFADADVVAHKMMFQAKLLDLPLGAFPVLLEITNFEVSHHCGHTRFTVKEGGMVTMRLNEEASG